MPKVPMPEFPLSHNFPDTVKGWAAREKNRADWYAFWRYLANLRFHTPQEDKGVPVEGTGKYRWHSGKNSGKTGVSGNSHVVSHRYMGEGDKGPGHRREIKVKERVMVNAEIREGMEEWDAATALFSQYSMCTWCDCLIQWDGKEWLSDGCTCIVGENDIHTPINSDYYRSTKFQSLRAEILWSLSLESAQNASLGEAESFGYFAYFPDFLSIIEIDNEGFVSIVECASLAEVECEWERVELDYEAWLNEDTNVYDDAYCCATCNAY